MRSSVITCSHIGMSGCRGGERMRADFVVVTLCYSGGSRSSWDQPVRASGEIAPTRGDQVVPGSIGAWLPANPRDLRLHEPNIERIGIDPAEPALLIPEPPLTCPHKQNCAVRRARRPSP